MVLLSSQTEGRNSCPHKREIVMLIMSLQAGGCAGHVFTNGRLW